MKNNNEFNLIIIAMKVISTLISASVAIYWGFVLFSSLTSDKQMLKFVRKEVVVNANPTLLCIVAITFILLLSYLILLIWKKDKVDHYDL